MLELIAVALALLHFGIPIAYYLYAKTVWLKKPWNIKIGENYRPRVSIVIPTYNEAKNIIEKLNNIYEQDYPKELIEVVVVDSASSDGTPELVERWAEEHRDVKVKLVKELERKGKARALNNALRYVEGDIVVITDADAQWSRDALSKAVTWFSDPSVGAVSCLKKPLTSSSSPGIEVSYRQYYNMLRVAESKIYSTPIFHGELAAFRRNLLTEIGGFPTDIGADDSYTATAIAVIGYRAIVSDNVFCTESIPINAVEYNLWRIRRAQHLLQSFAKALKLIKKAKEPLKKMLAVEAYLHLANPWILATAVTLLLTATLANASTTALAILLSGVALLLIKPYRAWVLMQLYLAIASIRNIYRKELVWEKQSKNRVREH